MLRVIPAVRIPHNGHDLPAGRLRVPVPDTHRDEARRHKNRQAGETDDPNRDFLRPLHGPSAHRDRLPLLRATLHRLVDADVDQGHVPQAQVRDPVSQRLRARQTAPLRGVHDQVSDVHDRRDHVQRVDLVREDRAQLEGLLQPAQGPARRSLCMKLARFIYLDSRKFMFYLNSFCTQGRTVHEEELQNLKRLSGK